MKKKKTGEVRYAKYGYIFSLPFVIAYLIFQLYPICYTIFIGFTDLQGAALQDNCLQEKTLPCLLRQGAPHALQIYTAVWTP